MVAEAGWTKHPRDHIAIAWVLVKRWRQRVQVEPSVQFVDVIRRYCAGLDGPVTRQRMRWVRSLPWGDGDESLGDWREFDASNSDLGDRGELRNLSLRRPAGWPPNLSWTRHRPLWRGVLRRAAEWAAGQHPDPCPRANHWGGPMDAVPAGAVICDWGGNRFFRRGKANK